MPRLRTSSAVELLLPVQRGIGRPLRHQLEVALRDAVRTGRLAPGSILPSTRALARQLGVSRGVAVEAYEQLTAEGYLVTRPGGATSIAQVPISGERAPLAETGPAFEYDFRPGRPDVTAFPRGAWLRAVRQVLAEAPSARLGYLDGRGMPELRDALERYLNRVRGTRAQAEAMVITTGFAQGLRLTARVLRRRGAHRIGVEDPSDRDYRAIVEDEGLAVAAIGVDGDGLRVDLLEAANVDAVVVTPAHQFPSGGVLPPERRAALIAWAEARDGLIIEDDYDAEFRYDRSPIGAMQGLCADRVVYGGTASKILAPGLRLGWLIAPRRLVEPLAEAKKAADHGSSALEQLALAEFIEHGELDRHLRRMRATYRRRRAALLAAIERHLPQLVPVGASAGLHIMAWLPGGVDAAGLVEAAATRGIGLYAVAGAEGGRNGRQAVAFGYGAIDEQRIEPGIVLLARAMLPA